MAAVVPFNRLVIDRLPATEVIALHIQCSAATAAERIRQRAGLDDRTTSLRDRNDEYSRVQLPLLRQLTSRVRVVEIDAEAEMDTILERIIAALPMLGSGTRCPTSTRLPPPA